MKRIHVNREEGEGGYGQSYILTATLSPIFVAAVGVLAAICCCPTKLRSYCRASV